MNLTNIHLETNYGIKCIVFSHLIFNILIFAYAILENKIFVHLFSVLFIKFCQNDK
jgi:cytochrome c oxidase subunit IV